MTLQERMVAVYLRQAKLPEAEKDKLRLFLGLLLTTLEEEEPWEVELRAAPEALAIRFEGEGTAVRSLGDARDDNTPVPEEDLWSRAEQSRAEQSRAEHPRRRRRLLPLARQGRLPPHPTRLTPRHLPLKGKAKSRLTLWPGRVHPKRLPKGRPQMPLAKSPA